MNKRRVKEKNIKSILLFFFGFSLGLIFLWPGIITSNGRKCFYRIIKDGSDGSVSAKTIFSISPNYLLKINNAKNKYFKVLLIGDYCFRRF